MLPTFTLPPLAFAAKASLSIACRLQRFLEDQEQQLQCRRNANNPAAIYYWIPKTAGTSLNTALTRAGGQTLLCPDTSQRYFKNAGIVTFGHLSVPELVEKGIVSTDYLERSWKFAIVRDPFDRAVSLFEYLRGMKVLPPSTTFSIFCKYLEDRAFERVGLANQDGLNQLNPQYNWLIDQDGRLTPDYIGRFEFLGEAFQKIFETLQTPAKHRVSLHTNKSNREKQTAQYYTDADIEIVRDVYAVDFEAFSYSDSPVTP